MAIGFGASDVYADVRRLARARLSAAGFQFVDDLVRQAEDQRSLWNGSTAKQDKALFAYQNVEARAEGIQKQIDEGYTRVETLADGNQVSRVVKLSEKAPEVTAVREELAGAKAEWERLTATANERGATVRSCDQLLQSLGRYLNQVETKLEDAPTAKPKPKDISLPTIEAARAEVGRLKAQLDANKAAPVISAQRKREAAELVARLADRGIPRLFDLASGTLPFEFPTLSISHSAVGALSGGRDIITVAGNLNVPDALGVLAWLLPEQMQAAIEKEIDLVADDAAAVTDEVRAERDTAIKTELLAAEREEEALVRAAISAGLTIQRRPNADVRAVLAVNGPDPAEL